MNETFYEPGTIPPWNREADDDPDWRGDGLHPVIRRKRIVEATYELGEDDFRDGVDRIPAQSGALQGLHMQLGTTFGEDTELLRTWLEGWDSAMLAAPLPDEEDDYDGPLDGWDNAAYSAAAYGGSTFRACRHGDLPGECPSCNPEEG